MPQFAVALAKLTTALLVMLAGDVAGSDPLEADGALNAENTSEFDEPDYAWDTLPVSVTVVPETDETVPICCEFVAP